MPLSQISDSQTFFFMVVSSWLQRQKYDSSIKWLQLVKFAVGKTDLCSAGMSKLFHKRPV